MYIYTLNIMCMCRRLARLRAEQKRVAMEMAVSYRAEQEQRRRQEVGRGAKPSENKKTDVDNGS